jgi:hypothetical protein
MKELLEDTLEVEDKEKMFDYRTNMHIELVKKAADQIASANPEFREFDGTELMQRAEVHDASKFEEPERSAYIELNWRKFKGDEAKTPEIDKAVLHHITTNRHHPEFGKEPIKGKPTDASEMTNLDIAEMVADWQGMSEELKTNTAREWYEAEGDKRWIFTPEQKALIDKLLKVFE